MVPHDDGASPAPIDRAVLERLRELFAGTGPLTSATIVDEGKPHLRVELSDEYYPLDTSSRIEIRWYRNDDFAVHYREERQGGVWNCRWDRHPNAHNSRDHFHPPPDADRRDAEDARWPDDHRGVCRLVLDRVEERIETLWERE